MTDVARAVRALQGMAYEHRLHILMLLRASESTPGTLSENASVHPTAIAHHLRHLLDAGLVRRRREGRHVYYRLADEATVLLLDDVVRFAQAGRQRDRPVPAS
ncbi:metalloregulator ArsR/SmtB family transcription factor [Actinoplanes sp. NPDC051851]|uniref:ArsR/SmtB family transcription factor n=1 Tax=Actinoplanes sp. NPDC051851 TaxID=3154753 RepID=UPI003448B0D8